MTHMEIKALENAGRTSAVWTESYDGTTHYGDVLKALAPALVIMIVAATLLFALL